METGNLDEKKAEKNLAKKIARIPSAIFNKIRHFDKEKFKAGCRNAVDALQANGKVLFGTVVFALVLMFAVCWSFTRLSAVGTADSTDPEAEATVQLAATPQLPLAPPDQTFV